MIFSFRRAGVALCLVAAAAAVVAQDENPAFISKCAAGTWALTFDDGPSPYTPELLGYLKQANVKATFFVIGLQMENPTLRPHTKAAFDDGHLIASHTYDHKDLNAMSAAEIESQMTRTEALTKSIIGRTPRFMRPPYGNCSATCAAVMKKLGYSVFTWNVDSNDWRVVGTKDEPKAFEAFTTVLANPTGAAGGFQSLQHDIHQFSVKYVPQIIKAITDAKLRFVTVDECMASKSPAYLEGVATQSTATPTTTAARNTAATESSATIENAADTASPVSAPSGTSPAFQITASWLSLATILFGATLLCF